MDLALLYNFKDLGFIPSSATDLLPAPQASHFTF